MSRYVMDFLRGKKIVVMGLGRTGISVLKKLSGFFPCIMGVDDNPELDPCKVIADTGINNSVKPEILTGIRPDDTGYVLKDAGLVVISPGIPAGAALVNSALKMNIPVWSELELGWRLLNENGKQNVIAVTGTNGKTTVVKLLGKIFDEAGKDNVVCGNVGFPLTGTVNTCNGTGKRLPEPVRIVEVSSFQMEWTHTFKPKVAVILNITEDHIDRHGSMETYGSLKFKLSSNQGRGDFLILNTGDPFIRRVIELSPDDKVRSPENGGPQVVYFSLDKFKEPGLFYSRPEVFYIFGDLAGKINIEGTHLAGSHNISNIMAATASALLSGIDGKVIERAVKDFRPPCHRMEYLGEVNHVRCINDSKSTNPDATLAAINDFNKEVTLILGGRDKNMDFSVLIEPMNKKVKNLILIGESAPVIYALMEGKKTGFKTFRCSGLEEAVRLGFEVSSPGDVLLLSPACASMDMFKDYRERGNRFRELVLDIRAGKNGRKDKQV